MIESDYKRGGISIFRRQESDGPMVASLDSEGDTHSANSIENALALAYRLSLVAHGAEYCLARSLGGKEPVMVASVRAIGP